MHGEKIKNFFHDFCESEKHYLPNFIPVGIGVGICLYFSLDDEPNFYLSAVSLFLTIIGSIFLKNYRWVFCILLTLSLGFFVSQLRTKNVDTFMLSEKIDRPVSLIATVESCEKSEKGIVFIVDGVKILSKSCAERKFNKLYLSWRGKKAIKSEKDYVPGAEVLFRVILSPIDPMAFPGAYDFRKQMYFKGISARGFLVKQPKILKCNDISNSLVLYIEQLRHKINKRIESYLPTNIAAVSEALTTGNKTGIAKEVRAYFSNSGTAHILAISGLHIGIIGFFVFLLARLLLCCILRISMFYNAKKIAAVISWIVVLFYLYISGNSVPSLRAFIMHSLIMIAILLNRVTLTMRSVAIAATIIMLFTPEVILFPSFQMSFGAVIAIVAFYEHSFHFMGFFRTLLGTIATTVVATIPTSIFSVNTFNQLTLNSIPANLLSIPLMSFFIMPVAAMVLFFMIFNCEYPFILLMGYGVNLLIKISEYMSKLPGSFFVMHTPSAEVLAILIFSGLLITLVHHKIRFLGLAGLGVGVVFYFLQPLPDIFVSRNTKVVGIRTDDGVCFNHLGYFRSVTNAWAKSIGFEKRQKFNSEACSKYISQISKSTYVANIKNNKIIITAAKNYEKDPDESIVFHLNKKNDFAELIYLPSQKRISNKFKKRPWS